MLSIPSTKKHNTAGFSVNQPELDSGQIEKLTSYLESGIAEATPAQQEILRVKAASFDKNKDRMRYPAFRA